MPPGCGHFYPMQSTLHGASLCGHRPSLRFSGGSVQFCALLQEFFNIYFTGNPAALCAVEQSSFPMVTPMPQCANEPSTAIRSRCALKAKPHTCLRDGSGSLPSGGALRTISGTCVREASRCSLERLGKFDDIDRIGRVVQWQVFASRVNDKTLVRLEVSASRMEAVLDLGR